MQLPEMTPTPGQRMVRHAGDLATFTLRGAGGQALPPGWRARLRTNVGRADEVRDEIVRSHFERLPLAGASWRDIPMREENGEWHLTLALTEAGFFKAKAYALDPRGFQHWPSGPDIGISVHPSWTRSANTVYCAFPRMFGPWSKEEISTKSDHQTPAISALDEAGFNVIPPSGTLRDLIRELPHIVDRLGCRILHLLPVSPTPTTFARFGRFGSPYALQHLTAIDPALVEFDKRTNGVDQFVELTTAAHRKGARVFLDLVINHTGWGSDEWENHPEWFLRGAEGKFHSPGAWDVVWEDLVEFDQRYPALWDHLADAFLTWCQRGVDGFRCDAGYKVPTHVWQFITAKVRRQFPNAVFLLEGLGGPWDATESLLTEGGMQWAYSELFQNFGPQPVASYLDHANRAGQLTGTLFHYSETHDNARLAANGGVPGQPVTEAGYQWSLHRNRLSALTSITGGYGFTCGVEWCATEQINVHSSRGMAWNQQPNLVPDLAGLNRLLADHPAFFDGAQLTRLTEPDSSVYALRRDSAEGLDTVLVLANLRSNTRCEWQVPAVLWKELGQPTVDLIKVYREIPVAHAPAGTEWRILESTLGGEGAGSSVTLVLEAGACLCLAGSPTPRGLSGDDYRRARAQADWATTLGLYAARLRGIDTDAFEVWSRFMGKKALPSRNGHWWRDLAALVEQNPEAVAGATLADDDGYHPVVVWQIADRTRVVPVPSRHWLLVRDIGAFRATLATSDGTLPQHVESIPVAGGHVAAFKPKAAVSTSGTLTLDRLGGTNELVKARLEFLSSTASVTPKPTSTDPNAIVLLTNGRGAMSRLAIDIGRITSKYDCLLGANLHPEVPVDRHVFAKRVRLWLNADGFLTPLNNSNLVEFEAGPPAHWKFIANAGDGRSVEVHLVADMIEGSNAVVLHLSRPGRPGVAGHYGVSLPDDCDVRITARIDIEDRNFHWETKRNEAADYHFSSKIRAVTVGEAVSGEQPSYNGFAFQPDPARQLSVYCVGAEYHQQPEWCLDLPHPVEASRGMQGAGDAYSPGWFEIPLIKGGHATLVTTAEIHLPTETDLTGFVAVRQRLVQAAESAAAQAGSVPLDEFGRALVRAAQAYVVKRDSGKTVIAGYPWFLDWGRDSLIAARGLLAAGMHSTVRDLLVTFAKFEICGTLPNSINGEDAGNRDTSDAPLWFGVVCEEFGDPALYNIVVDSLGRTIKDVLRSIASGYLSGTPNGITVDHASGLVWSPSHFTWMDTNHPAGSPREGYPVEIQVLWIRLLQQLAGLKAEPWDGRGESWADLARRTQRSFEDYFWLEELGWYADFLPAKPGRPARSSPPDNSLRSNCLFAVSLGLVRGERARRMVRAAACHLVIPGGLRSLAPLPVIPPLPLWHHGRLLNDPDRPYWGHYEGDEDTRRKPAYHNGTAWGWTLPTFCEALALAYDNSPEALRAAHDYLAGAAKLLREGCLGHLPEIMDGDAPHTLRGCDAQAWSVTETLRVWRWLQGSHKM
ncbi:MAG TPA: amylo-alpha-1,6-glucosidase [Candidatus Limnocylindria bacterium]|nr:amylo-alpha-1,6-glucosidase [Candidatus Limnocylindria bacterium]